ncbi:MAG: DinB family protein [Verrucomicrobiota bacterium]
MKSLLCSVVLAIAAALPLAAQDASAADKARANEYLANTKAAFLTAVTGLSDAQLNFKPGPTRWSVAEVSEHIASAEDFLLGMVQTQVMKAPARTEEANLKEIDDFVLTVIPDRTNKVKAPEPLVPTKRFGSAAGSVEHFKESRAKTVAFLNDTKDLRGHANDSPLGKKLDAYQYILFISAHCERHTKQILEVKADPGFPKK